MVENVAAVDYIRTPKDSLSYAAFGGIVARVAESLRSKDIRAGDRVVIIAENSPEMVALFWGIWQCKAIAAPLNIRWSEEQIGSAVDQLAPKLIVSQKPLKLPSKWRVVDLSEVVSFAAQTTPDTAWLNMFHQPENLAREATIIFTSGSSGNPKAALHTLGNHYYSALGSNSNIPFSVGDSWLLNLPLYHVGGLSLLFRSAVGGGTIALPENNTALLQILESLSVTHISMVTTQLYRVLSSTENLQKLAALKAILLGGSAIPHSLIDRAMALGLPIFISYGSTEMASQITTTAGNTPPAHRYSAGKPLPYRQLRIDDNGEILVRGKTLFKGYWQKGTVNRPTIGDGWFPTGDVGILKDGQWLYVVGRRDNMFISGGENIHPETIETVLTQLPNIRQAVVVPFPDSEFGQVPVAFIDAEPFPQTDSLKAALRQRLAGYQIPKHFLPWPNHQPNSGQIKLNRGFFIALARKLISDHQR